MGNVCDRIREKFGHKRVQVSLLEPGPLYSEFLNFCHPTLTPAGGGKESTKVCKHKDYLTRTFSVTKAGESLSNPRTKSGLWHFSFAAQGILIRHEKTFFDELMKEFSCDNLSFAERPATLYPHVDNDLKRPGILAELYAEDESGTEEVAKAYFDQDSVRTFLKAITKEEIAHEKWRRETFPVLYEDEEEEMEVKNPLQVRLESELEASSKIDEGAIIELGNEIGKAIDLVDKDGKVIAKGDLIDVEGNYGFRVTEVVK